MTIELRDLVFHAFHGLYPEERKTGNEFRVTLQADYIPGDAIVNSIDETINYAALFTIVKSFMDEPHDLLETLAMKIAAAVKENHNQVQHIRISISKEHPPIPGYTGAVGITYQQTY